MENKELTLQDWDGQEAYMNVWNLAPNIKLKKVVGYMNGKWMTEDGISYLHCSKPQLTSRLATCLELATWVARGNGLIKINERVGTSINYDYNDDNEDVLSISPNILIRPFGKKEWVRPTIDAIGLKYSLEQK